MARVNRVVVIPVSNVRTFSSLSGGDVFRFINRQSDASVYICAMDTGRIRCVSLANGETYDPAPSSEVEILDGVQINRGV